jgi:LEA14-like dessication related protein
MIALMLMSGCVSGNFDSFVPRVRFSRFDVKNLDFEHIDTDFVFSIDNPNPVGIPLERFSYSLGFEGVEVLTGNATDDLSLEAEDSSEVALPVSLVFSSLYELVQATRGEDTIGFRLQGGFGFDSDIGPVDITYDAEDEFPAVRIPKVTIGELQIKEFDLSQANLALNFAVDNDHGSMINLHDMNFKVKVAGVSVGGDLQTVGDVPGATTDNFQLPFAIDYVDAIQAIDAAVSGQKLKVDMGADVEVDTPFGVLPLNIDETGNVGVEQQ